MAAHSSWSRGLSLGLLFALLGCSSESGSEDTGAGTGGGAGDAAGGGTSAGGATSAGGTTSSGGAVGAGGSTGGSTSGGSTGMAGAMGSAGTGGTATGASGLPVPPGAGGLPAPAGAAGNLKILNWAGFSGAMTMTIDDSAPSAVAHEADITATGVPVTWFLTTSSSYITGYDAAWKDALAKGDELGNHTVHHCNFNMACNGAAAGTADAEIDGATTYMQTNLGVATVYTMAYPFGDLGYKPDAQERFFLARGVGGGLVGANDATDPFALPCLGPNAPGTELAAYTETVDTAAEQGKWAIFLFHGLSPNAETWEYATTDVTVVTDLLAYGQGVGSIWTDTLTNIGAYWLAQKLVSAAAPVTSGADTTWSWTLPAHFPPGKYLRVSVDGGTLKQNGAALAWDAHGYYEVALDAGSLTLSP